MPGQEMVSRVTAAPCHITPLRGYRGDRRWQARGVPWPRLVQVQQGAGLFVFERHVGISIRAAGGGGRPFRGLREAVWDVHRRPVQGIQRRIRQGGAQAKVWPHMHRLSGGHVQRVRAEASVRGPRPKVYLEVPGWVDDVWRRHVRAPYAQHCVRCACRGGEERHGAVLPRQRMLGEDESRVHERGPLPSDPVPQKPLRPPWRPKQA
mmetsp:Transcript_29126/g.71395  ORF Transcript_29126/g.71395 Transcript_29126/m.71395 type:complete len:207 (+) Transcript_29126:1105-1725(+)